MALPNPSLDPPDLSRPSHGRSASSSPTRLTARRRETISQDALLRDLSPTKTLQAFTQAETPGAETALVKSLEHATETDRAFGVKIAEACRDLRQWATEVEAWEWPGSFEPPSKQDREATKRRLLAAYQAETQPSVDTGSDSKDAFWGSLPQELVIYYESRMEDIHRDLVELDVESLKSHIRNAHVSPAASDDTKEEDRVRSMNDFTALITATILQALPYLSRLNRLLTEWTTRTAVSRKVPGFLRGLVHTQRHLDTAEQELSSERHDSRDSADSFRAHIEKLQAVLGDRVSGLGQRLDNMLDELEGTSDSLPDLWIDRFEALEMSYSEWVVKAERIATSLTWEFDLPASSTDVDLPSIEESGNAEVDSTPVAPRTPSNQTPPDTEMGSPTLGNVQFQTRRLTASGVPQNLEAAFSKAQIEDQQRSGDKEISNISTSSRENDNHANSKSLPLSIKTEYLPVNSSTPQQVGPQTPTLPISAASIAARRALFNGDLETKQTLTKTQSPVRPFEHASNAFTKLFRTVSGKEDAARPKSIRTVSGDSKLNMKRMSFASNEKQAGGSRAVSAGVLSGGNARDGTSGKAAVPTAEDRDWSDKVAIGEPQFVSEAEYRSVYGKSDRFDSPMTSNQGTGNWARPFSTAGGGEEISNPGLTINADAFENRFVNSLPENEGTYASNLASFEDYVRQVRASGKANPSINGGGTSGSARNRTIDRLKPPKTRQAGEESGSHRRNRSDEVTSARNLESKSSGRSRFSTPVLGQASTVGFAKAHEVYSPSAVKKKRPETQAGAPATPHIPLAQAVRSHLRSDSDADLSGSEAETVSQRKSPPKKRASNAGSSPSSFPVPPSHRIPVRTRSKNAKIRNAGDRTPSPAQRSFLMDASPETHASKEVNTNESGNDLDKQIREILKRVSPGQRYTISPAYDNEATWMQRSTDSETRLYHLHQPGRAKPIKLCVRLVGPTQQIMVRTGNTWQDLETYLRQSTFASPESKPRITPRSAPARTAAAAAAARAGAASPTPAPRKRGPSLFPGAVDHQRSSSLPVTGIEERAKWVAMMLSRAQAGTSPETVARRVVRTRSGGLRAGRVA